MTDDDKEVKLPTQCSVQVPQQEVWALFENIWSNVCQTRWASVFRLRQTVELFFNLGCYIYFKIQFFFVYPLKVLTYQRKSINVQAWVHPDNPRLKCCWCCLFFISCDSSAHPSKASTLPPCHISAWTGSKRWALTLTPWRAPSQPEVLRRPRTPCSVCTNCPPWCRSCSRPSAGTAALVGTWTSWQPSHTHTYTHARTLPAVTLQFPWNSPYVTHV